MSRQRVPNEELFADTARYNLLVNGGMEVWQRGAGPFTASAHGADRWLLNFAGSGASISVSRDPSNIDSIGNSRYSMACTAALGSGFANIGQVIEDYWQLRNRPVSLSVRVRTTLTLTQAYIQTTAGNTLSTAHTGDGTWQTLSCTADVPANTTYITAGVILNSGVTYLDNAMLVQGRVPADYVPLHPADEMTRCMRYYEVVGGTAGTHYAAGQCYATNGAIAVWMFKVKKAVPPVITVVNVPDMFLYSAVAAGTAMTSLSAQNPNTDGTRLQAAVASGLVAGNGTLYGTNAASYVIAEANP